MKKFAQLSVTALIALSPVAVANAADAAPRTFKNCTQLNKQFPHGVGLPGARDKTSGKKVTTFKRNKALYQANKKSDRDRDGIACEKR